MMKKISILFLLLTGLSCNEVTDIFEENFFRGGFVQFTSDLETTRFNLLRFEEAAFSADVDDPNGNVTSYALALIYGDIVVESFIEINTFPNTVSFTGTEILSALNLTVDDLDVGTPIRFLATITTPDGIFSGGRPDFDADTNTQVGGDTAAEIFASELRQAVDFSFSLFLPPPRRLRGTSFEEPVGAPLGTDYTRANANEEGELLNNDPNLRSVMYTAIGNGEDDEIGFRTFYIDTGDSGFTSEEIGVSSDPSEIGGSFLDGNQAYQIEDTDGIIRIEFDRVDIDPSVNPTTGVQIQYLPADRGNAREASDGLVISALVERSTGTETLELVNLNGLEIDEGLAVWNLASTGFLQDVTAYTLIIEVNVDSGNEDIYFDQMLVFIPDA